MNLPSRSARAAREEDHSKRACEEDREDDEAPRPERRVQERPHPRRLSTEKKLRRASQKLDAALMQVYERFCRSEITHADMRTEQNALIHAFNDRVRSENIRYRSFLRKRL